MKDFLKRDLEVGDTVVFTQLGYRDLRKGRITRMTAQMVFLEQLLPNGTRAGREIKQKPEQLIKVI